MTLRQITQEEWAEQEWIDVTTYDEYASGKRVFISGVQPQMPDDGFAYELVRPLAVGDEPKWFPLMTDEPEEQIND